MDCKEKTKLSLFIIDTAYIKNMTAYGGGKIIQSNKSILWECWIWNKYTKIPGLIKLQQRTRRHNNKKASCNAIKTVKQVTDVQ